MAVFERSELTTNEEVLHIRCEFERVAVGNNDVGGFADLERAQLVRETEDLGRIKRDGLEALFRGETVGDGVGGILAKATGKRIVKTATVPEKWRPSRCSPTRTLGSAGR